MNIEEVNLKSKQKKFLISENDDFNQCLYDIFEKSNVGDIVEYITNNQLGLRIYEIILNQFNQKIIKEIGNIDGLYNDPNRFNEN